MVLRACGDDGGDRETAYCGQRPVVDQDGIASGHLARYGIGRRMPVLHKRKVCFSN